MNVTLSIEDEVLRLARKRADALGSSVNQLIRDYLHELAGNSDRNAAADEFEKLSRESTGNSSGWKFDREEVHSRR